MKESWNKAFLTLLGHAYVQLASVMGALSLGSLASNFIEWKGVILQLINWWADTARPVVDFIYAPLIDALERLMRVEIVVPVLLKDYLAVGIVLILSRWRGSAGGWSGGARRAIGSALRNFWRACFLLVRTLLVWPAEIVFLLRNLLFAGVLFSERTAEEIYQIRVAHFLALLPVLYSILLALANWLLRPLLEM